MSLMEKYDLTKLVSVSNKITDSEFYRRPELDLSVQQKKLVFYLISGITKDTLEFSNETIDIKDYCELFDIKLGGTANREWLRKSLLSLAKKAFFLKLPDGSEEIIRWVDKININYKSGKITLRLSDSLKIYLLELKRCFTQFQLGYTTQFKSKYSYDLYLICKGNQFKKEFFMPFEELKSQLLHGENTYERFYDFKKYCLEPAIKEINDYTDIVVQILPRKTGTRITEILFYIRKKRKSEMASVDTWKAIQKTTKRELISADMDRAFKNDIIYDDLCEEEENEQISMFSHDELKGD